jgi:AraC-like DNA-binding protein
MSHEVRSIRQEYWRHADLPYVELRSTHKSAQPYKMHSHDQLSIGAIEEGITRVRYQGQEQIAREGDLVLIESNQPHSCNPQEGQLRSYHMLYLDMRWCLRKLSAIYGYAIERIRCDQFRIEDPLLFKNFLCLVQALQKGRLAEAEQQLECLTLPILSRYCVPNLESREEHEVTRYVRRHFMADLTSPASLDVLACELECRKETIIRLFKRDTGLPPMAFLNNMRIERAKSLLRAGINIAAVAAETGFVDQSHLHKAFVNYTAATPRQYQQARSIIYNNPMT